MFTYKNKNIQIYLDGPSLDQIRECDQLLVDGFTFNPSLFKSLGAVDYVSFCRDIIDIESSKPVSLEVISDDYKSTVDQALILSSLSDNINVKIPITFTDSQSTIKVIRELIKKEIKLNITAIFSLKQIQEILQEIKNTDTILSVFAGRLYDIGIDAKVKMKEISEYVKKNSDCRLLWASPRMIYDVISAIETNTDIITIQHSLLKKINLFGLKPEDYSLETVNMFYNDALTSKYKI